MIVKRTLQASLIFLLCRAAIGHAEDNDRYGQYVCQVESSVGITTSENGQVYSGPITLPSSQRTFGLTIRPVDLRGFRQSFCKQSLDYWSDRIQKGEPFKPYDAPSYPKAIQPRGTLARICLATDEAVLSYQKDNGESKQWDLQSYDTSYEFDGVAAGHWFQIYQNKTFKLSFPYDTGPIMSIGKCIRVPSSK